VRGSFGTLFLALRCADDGVSKLYDYWHFSCFNCILLIHTVNDVVIMKHLIDPTIDCVFKAILGMEGNEEILVHFLNCILMPTIPSVNVTIINPYNDKKFLDDKLSIVDIKAIDETGIKYQIEVQVATPKSLPERMLYTWSDIYQTQLTKGKNYGLLQPVISIWLLTGSFFVDDKPHHHFQVWDKENDLLLTDNCSIHVFELEKWHRPDTLLEHQSVWSRSTRMSKKRSGKEAKRSNSCSIARLDDAA
jgi:hypothetical protein